MPRTALSALLLLTASTAAAAGAFSPSPYLVRDIGDAPPAPTFDYNFEVRELVGNGQVAYFYEDDGIHGTELWRSDGTAAGTHMVRDICPGACGAEGWLPLTETIALVGDNAVFAANDGVHGIELWWTDGSELGTRMIVDISPGSRSSLFSYFTATAGLGYFIGAPNGDASTGLWRTDGTAAGTFRIAPNVGYSSMLANGSTLFFGREGGGGLWKTDGTLAGTVPLALGLGVAQAAWPAGAAFRFLPNGRLLFSATVASDPNSSQLWISDGSPAGTHALHAAATGLFVEGPAGFFVVGTEIFFSAVCSSDTGYCLWKSDGTDAGTAIIPAPSGFYPELSGGGAAVLGSELLFAGYTTAAGSEPWLTDGTSAVPLLDLRPGPESGLPSMYLGGSRWFATVGNRAVFLGDDGADGLEMWTTDGTPGGTLPLPQLIPGPKGVLRELTASFQQPVLVAHGALLRFRDPLGFEKLTTTDGQPGGATNVQVLVQATSAFYYPSDIFYLQLFRDLCFGAAESELFFAASDSDAGLELWRTSGDERETVRVADLDPGSYGSYPQQCASPDGSAVLFAGYDSIFGPEKLFRVAEDSSIPEALLESQVALTPRPIAGRLLGMASTSDGFDPGGVFLTDGSALGTTFLSDTAFDGQGIDYVDHGDSILVTNGALFRLDVESGSFDLLAGGDSGSDFAGSLSPIDLGPVALFLAFQTATGSEIWRTDGTPEGTGLLLDIGPGTQSGVPGFWDQTVPQRLTPLGSRALFAGDDGVHGLELWATDGTAAGTAMVADLFPGPYPSSPKLLTPLGGRVYFVAEHPTLGQEVWVTDGTAAGTHVLADLAPGAASSVPLELSAQAGKLYFSAWTPATGREAWKFDPLGPSLNSPPTLVADLAPGALSSSPFHFTQVGPRLYFVANDNSRGFELWALPDAAFALLFEDGFDSGNTSRWSATAP